MIRRIISKLNFKVVVLCVLAATTFWFLRALNNHYTTDVTYDLALAYDSSSYIPDEDPAQKTLEINISGSGWVLLKKNLGITQKTIVFNLSEASNPQYILANQIESDIRNSLKNVKVNYIHNDTIHLNFHRKSTKSITLEATASQLSDNIETEGNISVYPSTLEIDGPSETLTRMGDTLVIQPIKFNKTKLSKRTYLKVSSFLPENTTADVDSVKIIYDNFHIYINQKTVVPISFIHPPEKSLTISPEKIILEYKVDTINHIQPNANDFEIVADYNKLNSKDSTITLEVKKAPETIKDLKIKPDITKMHPANE